MRLKDRTAIVTGAGAGIGAATVRRFVSEGARVLAADRDPIGVEALAAELGAAVVPATADVGATPRCARWLLSPPSASAASTCW